MRRLLPLVLVVAACGSDSTGATTTAALLDPPTTTMTTEATETTSEAAAGPVSVCGRAQIWDPGTVYVAPCFAVPVAFEVPDANWRSTNVQEQWVYATWLDRSDADVDRALDVRLAVTAARNAESIQSRLDSIARIEGITPIREPVPTEVGGLTGLWLDVEGEPRQSLFTSGDCQSDRELVYHFRDGAAYPIASGPDGHFFGVGRCQVVRVWVLEAGDFLISIIGGTADTARHEEAVTTIESLFEGMTFQAMGSRS